MNELKDELRRISDSVAQIDKNTAVNTEVLKQHMQRTEANETRIKFVENWLLGTMTTFTLALLGVLAKILMS